VNDDWEVKVADFGLAKINEPGSHKGLHGSPVYMSPEMLLGLEYDEKTGTRTHARTHASAKCHTRY
jgi:serine/threonine protein kinase